MKTAREQAFDSISRLPSDATWEDVIYCLYVTRKIDEGVKAANGASVLSHDEVKRLFVR